MQGVEKEVSVVTLRAFALQFAASLVVEDSLYPLTNCMLDGIDFLKHSAGESTTAL